MLKLSIILNIYYANSFLIFGNENTEQQTLTLNLNKFKLIEGKY